MKQGLHLSVQTHHVNLQVCLETAYKTSVPVLKNLNWWVDEINTSQMLHVSRS